MAEEGQEKVSKYNSGVFIIQRLNDLWNMANENAINNKFNKWNKNLDRIWLEIARDLPDSEFEDQQNKKGETIKGYRTKFQEIEDKLDKTGALQDNFGSDFEEPSTNEIKNRIKQYQVLMEKDLFLRRLENKVGKGTKFDDTSEDDMD